MGRGTETEVPTPATGDFLQSHLWLLRSEQELQMHLESHKGAPTKLLGMLDLAPQPCGVPEPDSYTSQQTLNSTHAYSRESTPPASMWRWFSVVMEVVKWRLA